MITSTETENRIIVPQTKTKTTRALALDALRGIAILGMILSSRIPSTLPSWMFHAQNPPPLHILNLTIKGITWVDLVFPFFLFSLGAALPFALNKKLEKGESLFKIFISILERGLLLFAFAVFIQHIRPTSLNPMPNIFTNILALLLFVMLFFAYSRFNQKELIKYNLWFKLIGFGGLIIFLFLAKYPDNTGFSIYRSDIIIVVLANMALFGSLIWLATRKNILLRLSIFGILLAFRMSQNVDGSWMKYLWDYFQIPWVFKIYYLQYLFIVIPGTIIGDLIFKYLKDKKEEIAGEETFFKPYALWLMFGAGIIFLVSLISLLYSRWLVQAAVLIFIFSLAGFYVFRNALNKDEILLKKMFQWAAYWLIIGIMFESFEGGIQKAKPTLSFYFITTGLAIVLLISLTIFISMLNKYKYVNLLIDTGQNPMIAYAGGTNLIAPLLAITYIDNFLQSYAVTPWLGAFKGFIITLFLAIFTSYCTKKKIFWRT